MYTETTTQTVTYELRELMGSDDGVLNNYRVLMRYSQEIYSYIGWIRAIDKHGFYARHNKMDEDVWKFFECRDDAFRYIICQNKLF